MGVRWSPDLETKVRLLFADGMTMTEIAARVGQGLTKGSVVGKLHRLGLLRTLDKASSDRAQVRRAKREQAPARPPRPKRTRNPERKAVVRREVPEPLVLPVPVAPFVETVEGHRGIGLMELTSSTCRWPFKGDGNEPAIYCGAEVFRETPYCACHARVAYRPARAPRRR